MTEATDRFVLWEQIVDAARCTPSPHNVQPWRVKILSQDSADLYIDGSRTLPREDYTGSFLVATMGMYLEALDLVAAHRGMRVDAALVQSGEWYAAQVTKPSQPPLTLFAHLKLIPAIGRPVDYDASILLNRLTSRISLSPEPLPDAAIAALANLASRWNHRYIHIVDTAVIEDILAHNIQAVFNDMNLAPYHDEIVGWFRFTDRSAREHKDGLDWRCMNLSRAEFWMSAHLSRLLLFPPTRLLFKRRYRRQLGTIPAIGILSGDFFDHSNSVASGRFLMRFWLEVTRLGLYVHPYGNLVTNTEASTWLEARTGIPRIWLVFKIGFSGPPPRSHRRSLNEILIPTSDGAL